MSLNDIMMTHVGCVCLFVERVFSNGNIFPMDMNFLPVRASLDGHCCSQMTWVSSMQQRYWTQAST